MLCVGLDPNIELLPASVAKLPKPLFVFCKAIADATASLVCAFKPQIAYFAAQAAENQLQELIEYINVTYPHIPVILDAKRADIESTAMQYAKEAFGRYLADAVTVNPYMGFDAIWPYLEWGDKDKAVFILCRTSNPSGFEVQNLMVNEAEKTPGSMPLYQKIAYLAAHKWNKTGQLGLVMGATFPKELANVRAIIGQMPLLIPGIGTQGGDIAAAIKAGQSKPGDIILLNASRAILYASPNNDFAQAANIAATLLRKQINLHQALLYN